MYERVSCNRGGKNESPADADCDGEADQQMRPRAKRIAYEKHEQWKDEARKPNDNARETFRCHWTLTLELSGRAAADV